MTRDDRPRNTDLHPVEGHEGSVLASLRYVPFGAIVTGAGADGQNLCANDEFTAITGYSIDDIPTVSDWIQKASPEQICRQNSVPNGSRGGGPGILQDGTYRITCCDGSQKSIQFRSSSLPGERTLTVLIDVTVQETTHRDLCGCDQALEFSDHPVFFTDLEMTFTYANPACVKLWGYETQDDMIGRSCSEFWSEPDRFSTIWNTLLEAGAWRGEWFGKRADCTLFPVEISATVSRDTNGRPLGTVTWMTDVSEQRQREAGAEKRRHEERLHQSKRLEAIRQLAGGLAHDLNNILTAIIGNTDLLMATVGEDDEDAEILAEIAAAGNQAADMTSKLLTFSRRGPTQPHPVDLHMILNQIDELLTSTANHAINTSMKLQASHHTIVGDSVQIQAVFHNLGTNAAEAIMGNGRIEFTTANVELNVGDSRVEELGLSPGTYIEISVRDTGSGISGDALPHIFEPFFTTKKPGRGAGLGLASVLGSICTHNGNIRVDRTGTDGTTFKVLLPVCRDDVGVTPTVQESPDPCTTHALGHILVIDDESAVRDYAERALKRLGYQVTVCVDGEEAIAWCHTDPERFDLLLLDLVMPKVSGEAVFREWMGRCPQARILLSSGCDRGPHVEALLNEGARGFLGKPYTGKDLAAEVGRCLA